MEIALGPVVVTGSDRDKPTGEGAIAQRATFAQGIIKLGCFAVPRILVGPTRLAIKLKVFTLMKQVLG